MGQINRRNLVVSAAAASAAFGLDARFAFIPDAQAQNTNSPSVKRFQIGDMECIAINDGFWNRDHAADFIANATIDETKKALAEGNVDPSRISMGMTVLIVKRGDKTYLIDAGTGGQVVPTAGVLLQSLKLAGITPEQIDAVLLTHFHADHVYGLMQGTTEERVFPNAQMIVAAEEFAYWTNPDVYAEQPARRHPVVKRLQAFFPKWKSQCNLVSGEKEVLPGIRILPAFGHSPGHSVFHIASGADQFFFLADTANIPALFLRNPDWHVIFDQDPQRAEAVRRRMFDRMVADKALASCTHFAFPSVGRIEKDGKGYAYLPA